MPNVMPFSIHKTVILFVKTCQIQFCLEYAAGLRVLSIHVTLTPSLCDVNYSHRSNLNEHCTNQENWWSCIRVHPKNCKIDCKTFNNMCLVSDVPCLWGHGLVWFNQSGEYKTSNSIKLLLELVIMFSTDMTVPVWVSKCQHRVAVEFPPFPVLAINHNEENLPAFQHTAMHQ